MKISKAALAASPHLYRLLDSKTRAELGILAPEHSQSKTDSLPPSTLKDVWSSLSAQAKKSLRGKEAKEHGIFGDWLLKNKLPFIHAACHRKVRDLPPGWPDFSLFRPSELGNWSDCLLLEFKVPGGVLSWEQKEWMKLLPVHIVPNALAAMRQATLFYSLELPVLNQTQELEFS